MINEKVYVWYAFDNDNDEFFVFLILLKFNKSRYKTHLKNYEPLSSSLSQLNAVPYLTLILPYLSRLFNSLDVNIKVFGIICLNDIGGGGKSVLSTVIPERFPFVHPLEYWKVCAWIWLTQAKVVIKIISLNILKKLHCTSPSSKFFLLRYHSSKITASMIENCSMVSPLYPFRRFWIRGTRYTSNQIKVMEMMILSHVFKCRTRAILTNWLLDNPFTHSNTYQFRVIVG